MKQEGTFTYLNKEYKVIITRKRMNSIRYRLRDDTFLISAPYLATKDSIQRGLVKYAPILIKKVKPQAKSDDFIYIFGYKYDLYDAGTLTLNNGQSIFYKDINDLDKKLKKSFLSYMTYRVRYFENIMQLNPHNVRVRKMNTRYGSNSKKTNTVCFSLTLLHYSPDIIDSVVVHELAHSIHFDHSKAFYSVVYKYCKDYDRLHKKLSSGVFL